MKALYRHVFQRISQLLAEPKQICNYYSQIYHRCCISETIACSCMYEKKGSVKLFIRSLILAQQAKILD